MRDSGENVSATPRTVLIVEDDDALRDALVQLFTLSGWTAAWAANGRAALDIFRADAASLIISDIIMPDVTGIELVKGIRDFDNHTPIIILTGFGSFDNCLAALRAGASDFREKPFDNQDLLATAGRLVDGVVPTSGNNIAQFVTLDAALKLSQAELVVPNRAASIVDYVVGLTAAAGMKRRRWAITRALSLFLESLVARAVAAGSSPPDHEALSLALAMDANGCRISIVSSWRDSAWEDPPRELPDPDASHVDRDRFLLHTFCDEFLAGSVQEGATLVFFRPRPERPLRRGA